MTLLSFTGNPFIDAGYLARSPHCGTKLTTFKGTQVRGALAPFTLTGGMPPEN
jgi:hypothetical protein